MTYNVFGATLSLTQSINQSFTYSYAYLHIIFFDKRAAIQFFFFYFSFIAVVRKN